MLWIIDIKTISCLPGNDNLHAITARKNYTLRVDMEDFAGATRYAEYTYFAVADEHNKYKLSLGTYSGNAGDYEAHFKIILFLQLTLECLRPLLSDALCLKQTLVNQIRC